jgi:hypothetical protein
MHTHRALTCETKNAASECIVCNLMSLVLQEQLEALMRGAGARSETDGITWTGFSEYYRRQEEEAKTLSSQVNKVAEIKGQMAPKLHSSFHEIRL